MVGAQLCAICGYPGAHELGRRVAVRSPAATCHSLINSIEKPVTSWKTIHRVCSFFVGGLCSETITVLGKALGKERGDCLHWGSVAMYVPAPRRGYQVCGALPYPAWHLLPYFEHPGNLLSGTADPVTTNGWSLVCGWRLAEPSLGYGELGQLSKALRFGGPPRFIPGPGER